MKNKLLLFVFTFIGITNVWAQSLPFKDSGSEEGKIVKVEVTGNTSIPLIFICGTHVYFTVEFDSYTMINGASVELEGYFFIKE